MAKKTKKRNRLPTVFAVNAHLLFFAGVLALFAWLAVWAFCDQEIVVGIVFAAVSLLVIFIILISPIGYRFSDQCLTIVYVLGDREVIPWNTVRTITEYGSWFEKHASLPYYEIIYPHRPCKFYIKGEVVKSRRTKKLLQTYSWNNF